MRFASLGSGSRGNALCSSTGRRDCCLIAAFLQLSANADCSVWGCRAPISMPWS